LTVDPIVKIVELQKLKDLGACKGMSAHFFYPERGEMAARAKLVCKKCPVKAECLDYSLTCGEHHGIWGGKTEIERRSLRRSYYAYAPFDL